MYSGQSKSILYWLGPLGSLLGHFGSYFNAPEQEAGACLEPILSLFLTCLATQNYLNGPKSGIVDSGTGYYHTELVGAFGG